MFSRRAAVALVLTIGLATALLSRDLPRKASDFTVQMPGSKPLLLSQYKGKAVVFLFILTTCSHCQKAITCLTKDAADYGPRGLQVVAAAVEEGAAAHVPDFVKAYKTNFPVGYTADYEAVYKFMQHPRETVPKMPLMSFIDKNGVIRAQYEGADAFLEMNSMEANLRKGIEDLLKH